MLKKINLLIILLIIFLSGCKNIPKKVEVKNLSNDPSLQIIFPVSNYDNVKFESAKHRFETLLNLFYKKYYKGDRYSELSLNLSAPNFIVDRTECVQSIRKKCYTDSLNKNIFIEGKFTDQIKGNKSIISLLPKSKKTIQGFNSIGGRAYAGKTDYSMSKLYSDISKATLPWKFEFNSQYPSKSIYSNFERLARVQKYSKGRSYKDPVSGKLFTQSFWLKSQSGDIRLNVEVFPYRNGSKVIIHAKVKPIMKNKSLDYVEAIEELEKSLLKVIES